MANIVETFTGTNGTLPAGWTASGSGSASIQSNALQVVSPASGTYVTEHASRAGLANGDAVVDITLSTVAEHYPELLVRSSSATTYGNGYSANLLPADSLFGIYEWASGSNSALVTASFTYTAGATYRIRFRFSGSTLQAKIWLASGSEPGTWTVATTDTTVTAAGTLHLTATSGATAAARTVTYDNLTVTDLDTVTVAGTDTVAVTDTAFVAIPIPASDTAVVVDTASPAVTVGVGDTSQVADVAASTANPSFGDSVTAADSATIAIPVSATDTITTTDTPALTAAVAVTQPATVADSPSIMFPGSVAGNDPVAAVDTTTTAAATTGSDLASVSDAAAISIPVPAADTGTVGDAATLSPLVLGVDAVTGADSASSVAASTGAESAAVGDSATTVAPTSVAQPVVLGDSFTVGVAPAKDSATTADAASSTAQVGTPDTLTARDGATVDVGVADLVIAVWLVDPSSGALVALPDYRQITFGRKRDGISSLSMVYPVTGLNFSALYNATIGRDSDAEVEVWSVGAAPGTRFLIQEASGDDVKENSDWTFAGSSLEVRLSDGEVAPQSTTSTADVDLRINFTAATPGGIIRALLTQAQNRGALTDITPDFTSTVDTDGVAWPNVLTAHWAPATTYDAILAKLVSLGLVEWSVDWNGTSRVLHLWASGNRGTDRSLGDRPIVLRRGRNLTEAPRKWSVKNSATAVLASGSQGIYAWASDGGALSRRGRRIERSASAANLTDLGSVQAFAGVALADVAPGTLEVTHGLGFLPSEPRPVISFDVGDWLYSQTGTTMDRLRVVEWSLSLSDTQLPSGTVTLNDSQTESLIRLQDRLNALNSGDVVVGTSTSSVDNGVPTPPSGIVASSTAYLVGSDVYSSVTVGWSAPTNNVDGTVITDLAGYNIQFAIGTGPYQVGATVSSGSATSGSFTTAPKQTIHIQVRAFDQSGNASAWSSPATDHITAYDVTAPPATSTPVVSNYLGVLKIAWDGLTSTGGGMVAAAPDFDHVEVHISPASGFTPSTSTYFDRLYAAGTVVYTDGVYGTTYYAKLVPVDGSSNAGAASAQGSDTPAQVVSLDVFDGAIGTAKLADAAITTAKINDLAVNNAKIGDLSVGKLTAGILSVAVTLSGSIKTAATGQRVEMDTAGIRIYNAGGTQTVGMNPGTYSFFLGEIRTATSGQRMVVNPGGSVPDTINLYPSGGGDYARIMSRTAPSDGSAAVLIDGGAATGVGRGRLGAYKGEAFVSWVVGDTGGDSSAGYSQTAVSCASSVINMWAQSQIRFDRYNGSTYVADGHTYLVWTVGSGSSYCPTLTANAPGVNAGIKLDSGIVSATINEGTVFGSMKATAFTVASTGASKTDVVDIATVLPPLDTIRAAKSKAWKYKDDVTHHGAKARTRFGPIAEDLPASLVVMTPPAAGGALEPSISLGDQIGVLWAAVAQLADAVDALSGKPPKPAGVKP